MRFLNPLLLCLLPMPVLAQNLTLHISQHVIQAELAVTQTEREHGLMQRQHLCDDCGMLFVFPRSEPLVFWMKDTPLPLSIAFIDAAGHVVNIDEMQANTEDYHLSAGTARYALEMNRGWFARHGIHAGDMVQGLQQAPPGQ